MPMDRTLGIGGSDISIITRDFKISDAVRIIFGQNRRERATARQSCDGVGRILEDVIANEFAKRNSLKIKRRNKPKFHKTHKYMMGHVDRLIEDGRILEIKKHHVFADDN